MCKPQVNQGKACMNLEKDAFFVFLLQEMQVVTLLPAAEGASPIFPFITNKGPCEWLRPYLEPSFPPFAFTDI